MVLFLNLMAVTLSLERVYNPFRNISSAYRYFETLRTGFQTPSRTIHHSFTIPLHTRKRKIKRAADTYGRIQPNAAAVAVDDFFDHRQARPHPTAKCFTGMKPLKHAENLFKMPRFNADTVITHIKNDLPVGLVGGVDWPAQFIRGEIAHFDAWTGMVVVLDGVAD